MKRRLLKAIRILAAAGFVAVIALLALLKHEHGSSLELPTPTGPFEVGRTSLVWTSHNQPDGAPSRELRDQRVIWIWYPASPAPGAGPSAYLPPRWREALLQYQGPLIGGLLSRDPARVRAHSSSDAPISPRASAYPVLIMRAGLGALTLEFTTLAEDLASHGYIVVGFDAPYRTIVVVLPDGTVATRKAADDPEALPPAEGDRLIEQLTAMWVADLSFVVDRLEDLNRSDPSGRFTGRLALDRLGVFGHSLGGAVAAQFCHEDARCRAGVDMDGALHGSVVKDGLDKPFLFLLSDHGVATDPVSRKIKGEIQSVHDRLPPTGRGLITIPGANHFSFSDDALLKSGYLMRLLSPLDPRRGLAIAADQVRGFMDAHLKAGPEAALDRERDITGPGPRPVPSRSGPR